MNQILKAVYGKGTHRQVQFIADLGGMNETERKVLEMWHNQENDLNIQQELSIDKKTYEIIEANVRIKVHIALFDCVNFRMAAMEEIFKK